MDYQDHFYQLLITDHGYLLRTYFFDFAKVQDLLPLRMLNHNRRQLSRYFECYHFLVSVPTMMFYRVNVMKLYFGSF
jgi:hypothetical protein